MRVLEEQIKEELSGTHLERGQGKRTWARGAVASAAPAMPSTCSLDTRLAPEVTSQGSP